MTESHALYIINLISDIDKSVTELMNRRDELMQSLASNNYAFTRNLESYTLIKFTKKAKTYSFTKALSLVNSFKQETKRELDYDLIEKELASVNDKFNIKGAYDD